MSITASRDPIITYWYTDEAGDKISYLRTNETQVIVGNKILLNEIPDEYYKVQIEISATPLVEVSLGTVLESNEYSVDYALGSVNFDSSLDGSTATVTQYYARGVFYFPASRVWYTTDEYGEISQTVKDVLDTLLGT